MTTKAVRADLGSARLVCAIIRTIAEPHGYLVCLTGSVLYNGEGNDVDILLLKVRPGITPEALGERLAQQGMSVVLNEDNSWGEIGLKARYHGLTLDIAIIHRPIGPVK